MPERTARSPELGRSEMRPSMGARGSDSETSELMLATRMLDTRPMRGPSNTRDALAPGWAQRRPLRISSRSAWPGTQSRTNPNATRCAEAIAEPTLQSAWAATSNVAAQKVGSPLETSKVDFPANLES